MPNDESAPLKGKVILVSGASKRLGRCYALALARAGAQVVALARTLSDETAPIGTLREVERAAQAAGISVSARCCDITDEGALKRMVLEVADQLGGVDGIVNNAVAYSTAMECRGITHDVWNEAFNVNVRAPYVLIDTAAPIMEARGGGSVINITSLAAGPTGKGGGAHKGLLLYGLTKAALNRMTSWYAAELEERNIAVNAISPGDVSVYMRMANNLDPEDRQLEVVEGAQLNKDFWGGPTNVIRASLRHMCKAGGGTIVNFSSYSGVRPGAGLSMYGASKAGLLALAQSLIYDIGPNIRINSICPGVIETPMNQRRIDSGHLGDEAMKRINQLQRRGKPEELAEVALFLSCDESSFVSNAVIEASGGQLN